MLKVLIKRLSFLLFIPIYIIPFFLIAMGYYIGYNKEMVKDLKSDLNISHLNTTKMYEVYKDTKVKLECLQMDYDGLNQSYLDYQATIFYDVAEQFKREQELIKPIQQFDKKLYMEKYKGVCDYYVGKIDIKYSMYDYYSSSDIQYMLQCIETEVYQCDFIHKCNIASAILNRVDDSRFPNNPTSVVTATNQFAYHRTNISEDTKLALEYVILFGDTASGCIGFKSDQLTPNWNNWTYVFYDGKHYFYK